MPANQTQHRGVVTDFWDAKGYGFVRPERGTREIFVHWSSIRSEAQHKTLTRGQLVEFEVVAGEKGLIAINVTAVTPAEVRL